MKCEQSVNFSLTRERMVGGEGLEPPTTWV